MRLLTGLILQKDKFPTPKYLKKHRPAKAEVPSLLKPPRTIPNHLPRLLDYTKASVALRKNKVLEFCLIKYKTPNKS